jgi:hypothetical protein
VSPFANSVLHYGVAGLVSLVLYVKLGKEAAWVFFLSFVAYRMYKAIKFLSAGKSEVKKGEDGRLEKWDFKGSDFSFSADLKTMTARIIIPKGRTYTSDLRSSYGSKSVKGPIDVTVPLRSLDFDTIEDTRVVHKTYGGVWNDYRQDGTWGPAIHSHVTSSSKKTGNFDVYFSCYPGSTKGDVVPGLENLTWSRDSSPERVSYWPDGAISNRQTKDFLKRWNEMLELIK